MRNSVVGDLRERRFADKSRPDLRLQGQGEMKDGGERTSINCSYTSKGRGKERIGLGEGMVQGQGDVAQGLKGDRRF